MTAVFKAPGERPEIIEIENTLKAFQEAVGGHIESFTLMNNACVICNEEGRLLGLPRNCDFLGQSFVGPILVVGVNEDEFCDINEDVAGFVMGVQ